MSRAAAAGQTWRLMVLGVGAAILLSGCRDAGEDGRSAGTAAAEAGRIASRRTTEIERAFEVRAAQARDDLESARRAAETFLSTGQGPLTQRQVEAAREEARRALRRGSEVLGRAAEVGSRKAESWARLIQDRMMRLEETLNHLTGAGEHADS